jgi:ATP-binding cassette subfamily C protein
MRAYPRRTTLLIALLVLSGLAEGIGIAALLPLLELAVPQAGHEPSALSITIAGLLGGLGLAPRLEILLSMIVVGMLLKGVFRLLAMKQVGYTVAHVSTDLRLSLVRALLGTRWIYFTSQPAGRFANAIGTEAIRAASGYRNVCALFASVTQAMIYGAVAFLVSWRAALSAVFGGGLVVLVLGRLVELSRAAGRSQTELMNSLISRLTDAVQGIKPIKAMARERHLQPLLERETHEINRTQERQVLAAEALTSAQEPLLVILMAIALYVALTVGNQPLATVLVMAFLFYRLAGRISLAQNDYQSIAMGESAFWSLRESIDAALAAQEPAVGLLPAPVFASGIELDSIRFGYGERPILDRASMKIPVGQFVAITGPSGAGKTTIADLIVGLHQPQHGRVLIDGVSLKNLDLAAWRSTIGYVPQEMFLFHDSVYNNVALSDAEVGREAVQEALTAAGAWDFIEQLPEGLDTVLGERGSKLSGGQRQRIAIARALVHKPKLLVLDEITTALDPRTEAAICQTLHALRGQVTILSISHQPAMTEIADRVYRLEGGRLYGVEDEPARESKTLTVQR